MIRDRRWPKAHGFCIPLRVLQKRLEQEVGDEEAQQAEQRNDLHRDATGAGRLCSKAILGSALLSATCHVPLAQTRGCLLL